MLTAGNRVSMLSFTLYAQQPEPRVRILGDSGDGMSDYHVKFVDDARMPVGHDWAICEEHEDGTTLFIRRGVRAYSDELVAALLEKAWAGYAVLLEQGAECPQSSAATASP